MNNEILKKIGLNDKEISLYLELLKNGPQSVRSLAQSSGINRGTTYDLLKKLMESKLVSYYQQEKKQKFVAEDPEKIRQFLETKEKEFEKLKNEVKEAIPELKSIYLKSEDRPVSRYYEGYEGIKTILLDLLETMKKEVDKTYYAYSSQDIKFHLYKKFPKYTEERVKNKINVKVISIGSGGEDAPLSERKWLSKKEGSPSYILIYDRKVAMISLGADGDPLGIIIEDKNVAETQKMIFNFVWNNLE